MNCMLGNRKRTPETFTTLTTLTDSSPTNLTELKEKGGLKEVYFAPGEKICPEIIKNLSKLNSEKGKKGHNWYVQSLKKLFRNYQEKADKKSKTSKTSHLFFVGFIVGEGSVNVSAKKSCFSRFGIVLDPEFSVSQHINGMSHLLYALQLFKTGTIRYKSGSNATFLFRIDNRKSLSEKCIPFLERYCAPYASEAWQKRLCTFNNLLHLFQEKAHLTEKGFINQMLPLWDRLRKQRKQKNSSFCILLQAQQYAKNSIK